MGMSRPAVESTLFRARRRLTEEFDDIVSGARCLRIQTIIMTAADSRLGTRDTRRLARHLSHCQSCRREALAAGLDRGLFTRPPVRERIATRVAGFLPFPIFERFRRGADASPPPSGGRTASFASHLPMFSDQLASGWGKAAAGAALLVAGVGAGVGVQQVAKPPEKPAAVRTQPSSDKARTGSVSPRGGLRWRATPPPPPRPRERTTAAGVPAAPSAAMRLSPGEGHRLAVRRRPCHVGRRRIGAAGCHAEREHDPGARRRSRRRQAARGEHAGRVDPRSGQEGRRRRPADGRRRQRRRRSRPATPSTARSEAWPAPSTARPRARGPVGEAVDGATDAVDGRRGQHRRGFEPDHKYSHGHPQRRHRLRRLDSAPSGRGAAW